MKIGVVLPIGEDDETGRTFPYATVRGMALDAEDMGFDSVWLPDHLLFRFPDRPAFGVWECWSILTGLAEATSRIELGTLVVCLPFRNPALLAKMAITTDEVSGGRLILGLGAGWHQPEFDAFGVPFAHLADQFEEGIQIISPLLRQGRADSQGDYFSANDAEMRPRGPRPGGPPVLIASRGPRMMRLTARYADQWNAAWFARPEPFLKKHAELVDACRDVGRDPSTIDATVGLYVLYNEHLTAHQQDILPESFRQPDKSLQGTPGEIAAGLAAFADHGVSHLICNPVPNTPETLAELGKAIALATA